MSSGGSAGGDMKQGENDFMAVAGKNCVCLLSTKYLQLLRKTQHKIVGRTGHWLPLQWEVVKETPCLLCRYPFVSPLFSHIRLSNISSFFSSTLHSVRKRSVHSPCCLYQALPDCRSDLSTLPGLLALLPAGVSRPTGISLGAWKPESLAAWQPGSLVA